MITRLLFTLLASVVVPNLAACSNSLPRAAAETSADQGDEMKIRIIAGNKVVTATLVDNPTTQDFVSLLPLTLTMNDLFGREKFAALPRAISEGGKRTPTYEVGDVIYWSPGPDIAIYYRHDGQSIPAPGVIVLGKISGVEALNVRRPVKVRIELTNSNSEEDS